MAPPTTRYGQVRHSAAVAKPGPRNRTKSYSGAPYGNRTRVSAVKGRRPRPLDEGRKGRSFGAATYKGDCAVRQGSVQSRHLSSQEGALPHHFPVFGMESHGSFGGSGAPFCSSSIECLSGERTKAITPSRGGRLMVTPAFINFSHRP